MTDRMEPGTPGDNSAEPTKDPKTADGSQDCSCAEARAHLEAFLDRECTADLAERLTTLVTDSEAAKVMGEAARRRVEEHFAWEAIAQRTMDVYNWVLAQG